MNDIDHDESRDRNEDADAFEQRLGLLRPSPPAQAWSSIAESIEASLDQPDVVSNVKPTTSAWRPVVSHSITTLIGAAIGVTLMLTLPQKDSASNQTAAHPTEASSAVELADQQDANDKQPDTDQNETESLAIADESASSSDQHSSAADWRSPRLTGTSLRSGPLRAFGSIGRLTQTEMEYKSIQNSTQQSDPDDDDSPIDQINDLPLDKPVLSPRSLHLFLDELTCLPTLDIPFCKAKGCQS